MHLEKQVKRDLVLASSNSGKIIEFNNLLAHIPINLIAQPKNLVVEETGKTFAENARLKAIFIANKTGNYAIADDSGLSVNVLNGRPGIFSARYASSTEEKISKLLKELSDKSDRRASFTSAICVANPDGNVFDEVESVTKGIITFSPRGKAGFGYDPIFELPNIGLTFAEMSAAQKKLYSHRGKAIKLIENSLKKLCLNVIK